MNKLESKFLSGFKYVYLVMFFALFSGFFYPLVNHTPFEPVVIGVIVLFVGLAGGLLMYKSITGEKMKYMFLGIGLGLMGTSLYFIFQLTGRV